MKHSIVFAIASLLAVPFAFEWPQQSATIEGHWEAEYRTSGTDQLILSLRMRHDDERWTSGSSYDLGELPELAAIFSGDNGPVAFQFRREAGIIEFTGEREGDEAWGRFRWTGSPEYLVRMTELGYSEIRPQPTTRA